MTKTLTEILSELKANTTTNFVETAEFLNLINTRDNSTYANFTMPISSGPVTEFMLRLDSLNGTLIKQNLQIQEVNGTASEMETFVKGFMVEYGVQSEQLKQILTKLQTQSVLTAAQVENIYKSLTAPTAPTTPTAKNSAESCKTADKAYDTAKDECYEMECTPSDCSTQDTITESYECNTVTGVCEVLV